MRQVVLALASCFFLFFGISILIAAYKLKDPFSFIMTFFASNLIILISAALMAGFIIRMVKRYRDTEEQQARPAPIHEHDNTEYTKRGDQQP